VSLSGIILVSESSSLHMLRCLCITFRALACIRLIYGDAKKIPHLKGESFTSNSSYVPIYSDYIPTEFLINGIVSALLTVVNVICIFITAIMVLKIKEVAAPYTSSPDLRRYFVLISFDARQVSQVDDVVACLPTEVDQDFASSEYQLQCLSASKQTSKQASQPASKRGEREMVDEIFIR